MLALAMTASAQWANAQVKLPAASSTQEVKQALGIKNVSLIYQRPSMNGRTVFGSLVPYNEVWRTGANNATSITFEDEVTIQGTKVPAGTYSLFTIPTANEWTVIFNKTAQQWGSYSYKQEDDVLRVKVNPIRLNDPVETFTISFDKVTPKSLVLSLAWEKTKVEVPITVDQGAEIMGNLEKAMQGEKKPYMQAAQYYFNNNLDINKAAQWIEAADEGNTRAPHIKYWKSRILLKSGNKAAAVKAAEEGIKMATELKNSEYVKLSTQALEAAKK